MGGRCKNATNPSKGIHPEQLVCGSNDSTKTSRGFSWGTAVGVVDDLTIWKNFPCVVYWLPWKDISVISVGTHRNASPFQMIFVPQAHHQIPPHLFGSVWILELFFWSQRLKYHQIWLIFFSLVSIPLSLFLCVWLCLYAFDQKKLKHLR